jgi:hypothetical protein
MANIGLLLALAVTGALWEPRRLSSSVKPSDVLLQEPRTESRAEVGSVDFDATSAPCRFVEALPARDEFAGVTFVGPGELDGGAVLDECSNFLAAGYSPPNFPAFNRKSSPCPTLPTFAFG